MKLENLVTNLELSKRLFEEGVTKEVKSALYWTYWPDYEPNWRLHEPERDGATGASTDTFPALTCEELMAVMPKQLLSHGRNYWLMTGGGRENWIAQYQATLGAFYPKGTSTHSGKTPLLALSALCEWLLDNNLLPKLK